MSAVLHTVFLAFAFILAQRASVVAETCQTEDCKSLAKRILGSMDPTSPNPCTDFYKFTCKKYVDSAPMSNDKTSVSAFTEVRDRVNEQLKTMLSEQSKQGEPQPYKNVRKFYSLCMDEAAADAKGVGAAVAKLKEAGGWPVLGDWDESKWNWLDCMIKQRNLQIERGGLINIAVTVDTKVSNRRIIDIDQGVTYLKRQYLVNGMDDKIVQSYYRYIVDIAVLYGANRQAAEKEMKQSLEFEIEVAKLTKKDEERRDNNRLYNIFTLQKLKQDISWVNWETLFQGIMPRDIPLKSDEIFLVDEVDYLKQLKGLIEKTPKRVVANYMMWLSAQWMAQYTTIAMKDRAQKFNQESLGTTARSPRWQECIDYARLPQIALASMYVKRFFDKKAKTQALEIVQKIRAEMIITIREADWMDEETRKKGIEKANKMKDFIGYPDELLDVRKVEAHYENLVLDGNDFLETRLKFAKWVDHKDYEMLRQPHDKHDWREHCDIPQVNAFYNGQGNTMEFPAGILQLPFFSDQLPKYANYAAIGMIMGHEVTHGFDDEGSQFDANGDLKNWWSPGCQKTFTDKTKCFITQYGGFVDSITKMKLNGENCQGENIADNGGTKLAYQAYKKLGLTEPALPGLEKYNQQQMFYISLGSLWCARYRPEALKVQITTDPHSPEEFRVNGILKNYPEFSKVFGCTNKDAMNPDHKCKLW